MSNVSPFAMGHDTGPGKQQKYRQQQPQHHQKQQRLQHQHHQLHRPASGTAPAGGFGNPPAGTTAAGAATGSRTGSGASVSVQQPHQNQPSAHLQSQTQAPAPPPPVPNPSFPTHNSPRTWFITAALSPLAVRLIRLLLAHGDYVVACLPPQEIDHEDRGAEFRDLINECKSSRRDREGWKDRIRGIRCDGRTMSGCGAAVAEAVEVFGRIDILLCCKSEAVVGTVEELSTTAYTQNLVRDQFESVFFSQVNFIKAALPTLRSQHTGHIIILTSIGGHIATPGMSMYSAATWALEGFADSLAYEIAPFNVKVTVVQPNQEIQSLTNRLTFAPQIPAYAQRLNPAPNIRDILSNVLNSEAETAVPPSAPPVERPPGAMTETGSGPASPSSIEDDSPGALSSLEPETGQGEILHRYPKLPPGAAEKLVMETVHALTAIGGHENPPSRHIVGAEGAMAVREKLKTVSEELEDFVEASLAVDIFDSELKDEAREGRAREGTPPGDTMMSS